MKIFIDENIPLVTVRELRGLGHDVKDIRGTESEGMTDENIWEMLRRDKRLLVLQTKDLYRSGMKSMAGFNCRDARYISQSMESKRQL